jgi:hypothetical protein
VKRGKRKEEKKLLIPRGGGEYAVNIVLNQSEYE